MSAQLNYPYDIPKGNPGGKFDIGFDEVVTRRNEEADGVLKYGMAVMAGTMPGATVKVPTAEATAETIDGIALAAANTEHDLQGHVNVRQGVSLSIMRKGKVWGRLAAGATPTYGKTAYVVKSGNDAGCFTNTEGGIDIGAKFGNTSDTSDDGIAVIEIR